MQMLQKVDGTVDHTKNYYLNGVRSPSPSVNFIFGNTHLVPEGASVILWGPPKGGKSLIANFMIGQVHADYPDAIVCKFNTEIREHLQMTQRSMKMFGIDPSRYWARNTNKVEEIYDFIEKDIAEMCQAGAPIKLIVIDSITDIMGVKLANAESATQHLYGDDAATQKSGLRRIRNTLRKYGITLVMVAQERAVLDPVEVMRGKKTQMAGAYYLKHFSEYFVYVAKNEAKEGKSDILGNKFEDESLQDMMGNSENTTSKIKVIMNDSSVGIAKRVGEFTFDKFHGIINLHEEAFRLGVARNIFETPNNRTYIMKNWPEENKEVKWIGREECLTSIKGNIDLQNEIVRRVREADVKLFNEGKEDVAIDASSQIEEGNG